VLRRRALWARIVLAEISLERVDELRQRFKRLHAMIIGQVAVRHEKGEGAGRPRNRDVLREHLHSRCVDPATVIRSGWIAWLILLIAACVHWRVRWVKITLVVLAVVGFLLILLASLIAAAASGG
jgi:hypothetical protein